MSIDTIGRMSERRLTLRAGPALSCPHEQAARRSAARAAGRCGPALVVLLHGYGANGDDLIALADGWRRRLPEGGVRRAQRARDHPGHARRAAVVCPHPARSQRVLARCRSRHARLSTAFSMPSWRAIGSRPTGSVLVGFSQGTMMALHAGLRRAARLPASSAIRACWPGPEHLGQTHRSPARPAHSRRGTTTLSRSMRCTWPRAARRRPSVPVEWHVRPGLGHGIDPEGQMHGRSLHRAGAAQMRRAAERGNCACPAMRGIGADFTSRTQHG